MIGRRSTITIADAYHERFTHVSSGYRGSSHFTFSRDALYDFLFGENFDPWLLNAFRSLSTVERRGLKDFIMRIHTGESVVGATAKWTWERRRTLGQRILKDLAECLIRQRHDDSDFERYGDRHKIAVDKMQRTLELDGYVYRQGILLVPEESVIEETEEQDVLQGLIASVGLPDSTTLKHHLELSVTHYQESRWDDSISNSRKVLEGVLQQVAAHHSRVVGGNPLGTEALAKPIVVREYLESAGLLEKKEKEAVAQVYGLLSNTGGHPYIAQRDQARLMRHLALTFSQFVLLRLEGVLRAGETAGS